MSDPRIPVGAVLQGPNWWDRWTVVGSFRGADGKGPRQVILWKGKPRGNVHPELPPRWVEHERRLIGLLIKGGWRIVTIGGA